MLENLKKDVCEIAKRAQRDGLCKHKSGNFSARDVKSGYIVITPTSVDRELLTPRDMIVMDLEANVIENLSAEWEKIQNLLSGGYLIILPYPCLYAKIQLFQRKRFGNIIIRSHQKSILQILL